MLDICMIRFVNLGDNTEKTIQPEEVKDAEPLECLVGTC